MREIPFTKTQSVGNDFVLIHSADAEGLDLPAFAELVCERRFRIGADGLLVVGQGQGSADIDMQMFNPDGSEDFCGNGLRCAALHAVERGWTAGEFTILQHGLISRVWVEDGHVTAEMPAADFRASAIPAAAPPADHLVEIGLHGVRGTAVSTGSTHFVVSVDELPDDEEFFHVSPLIENDPLFPERTSVMWTKQIDDGLDIRIWERGAGETLGCGTGAAASAVVWRKLYGAGAEIDVRSRGGVLQFRVESSDQPYFVSNRPSRVFAGKIRY